MRPDQLQKLFDLEEKLTDVVLYEADPDNWPGSGQPIAELSQQERGDRYWCKKNAAATCSIWLRIKNAAEDAMSAGGQDRVPDDDMDKEIAKYERQAGQLLQKFTARGSA